MNDNDFFSILQAGLRQEVNEALSANPDWQYIYTLAAQQTVTGIVADGITKMGLDVPDAIRNQFLIDTTNITKNNLRMLDVQSHVCNLLEQNNLPYVILKGQGVAQCYPNPLLRISGDIDIYLEKQDYETAKQLLTRIGINPTDKTLAGEFAIMIDNVQVELHNNIYAGINNHCVRHFPELTRNLLKEARTINGFRVPSVNFDAIYLFVHTVRHLGSFGISLRQVLDWQMHLHRYHDEIDQQWLNEQVNRLHLRKLWQEFSILNSQFSIKESLWSMIKECGNFGCTSDYKMRHFRSHIHKRLYRTHFLLQQADKIKPIDHEFACFLKKREMKAFFSSIFRTLH